MGDNSSTDVEGGRASDITAVSHKNVREKYSYTKGASCSKGDYLNPGIVEISWTKMFENFSLDIIQTMKCFAFESFNLSCQQNIPK